MWAEREWVFSFSTLLNGAMESQMIGKLFSTVAILRSYNNKFVEKQVRNLLTIGLGHIIVVVNAPADKGATRGYLGDLVTDSRVQVIEMTEGYSWANALNIALMAIKIANVRRVQARKAAFRFVFTVSVEAGFTKAQIEDMLDAATDDLSVGVVGTSFRGIQDGNEISLGRSYQHPRNTGMLIRLEAFGCHMGGFDARCDAMGGMEDIDFCLSMTALSELRVEMLDLKVRLVVGTNYHQPTKEVREREAMDKIIAMWRGLFPLETEERSRIESAISEMGLETA
jgi:hypothetical protein